MRQTASRPRTGVFPEIQALRAIAVAGVVAFHFWPGVVRGGYAGVDVFFVISGYLITSHLLRELSHNGRLSLPRFYARRARRLLPAALLVISVSGIGTLLLLPQRVWEQVMQELIASTFYFENWVLAGDSVNYLAQSENIPSPVQHYWSLSVEEQFYLLWPLLLLLGWWLAGRAHRRAGKVGAPSRTSLAVVLSIVFIGSLLASVVSTAWAPGPAYFATDVRAWEFAAGGLVALFLTRSQRHVRLRSALSWLGLAFIGATMVLFTTTTPFPSYTALLPVVGTMLVIIAGNAEARWSPRFLGSLRPVQYLGDISYGLYLWHWPLLVFAPTLFGQLGVLGHALLLVAALLAAAATKRFVEDPIRTAPLLASRKPRATLAAAAGTMVVILAFALVSTGFAESAVAGQESQMRAALSSDNGCLGAGALRGTTCPTRSGVLIPGTEAAPRDDVNTPACWSRDNDSTLRECSEGPSTNPTLRVALIGDSHSNQYLAALQALASRNRWHFDVYGKTGCIWTGAEQINSPQWLSSCDSWKRTLNQHLASVTPYDVIITSYLATSGIRAATGKTVHQTTVDGFVQVWRPVAARGTQIVAIRDNPHPRADYLDCIDRHGSDPGSACSITQTSALNFFDGQPAAVSRVPGAHLLDLTKYFCQDGVCPPVIGNVIVYRDGTHLTSSYARTLAPAIREGVLRLTGLKEAATS